MTFWQNTYQLLKSQGKAVLLCVLESHGSSPGRQGFKMAVGPSGEMDGSIGGGIMEHKLVELSKSLLTDDKSPFKPFIKHQVHRAEAHDKSGMICSGEQTIAFYYINEKDAEWVDQLDKSLQNNEKGILSLSEKQISFIAKDLNNQFEYSLENERQWSYKELIGFQNAVYIIGGGHVGLALSSVMRNLDFHVTIIDDREGLNTLEQNNHAHQTKIVDYKEIDKHVPEGNSVYVVIASFGYRTDKVVLKQLIGRQYKYLGMMGSKEKVKQLYIELKEEGVSQDQLDKVHSPIGVQVKSKTPYEIAVSIGAQIVGVKNSRA